MAPLGQQLIPSTLNVSCIGFRSWTFGLTFCEGTICSVWIHVDLLRIGFWCDPARADHLRSFKRPFQISIPCPCH
jgi:hypothetical protein